MILDEPAAAEISDAGYELADLVVDLIASEATRWPQLPDALRKDPGLTGFEGTAWQPAGLPVARAGALGSVGWIAEHSVSRARASRVRSAGDGTGHPEGSGVQAETVRRLERATGTLGTAAMANTGW